MGLGFVPDLQASIGWAIFGMRQSVLEPTRQQLKSESTCGKAARVVRPSDACLG